MTVRFLAACPALCVAFGARAAAADAQETSTLRALLDREWEGIAQRFPEFGTYRGDGRFNDRLTDMAPEAIAAFDASERGWLAEAKAIRRERLGAADRVSLDMFIGMEQRRLEEQAFPGWHRSGRGS